MCSTRKKKHKAFLATGCGSNNFRTGRQGRHSAFRLFPVNASRVRQIQFFYQDAAAGDCELRIFHALLGCPVVAQVIAWACRQPFPFLQDASRKFFQGPQRLSVSCYPTFIIPKSAENKGHTLHDCQAYVGGLQILINKLLSINLLSWRVLWQVRSYIFDLHHICI